MISRLSSFLTRFFGYIILPAQVPGEPLILIENLMEAPWETLRHADWRTFFSVVKQILTYQKLTIPDDPQLVRLKQARDRYMARGWAHCPLQTVDGVNLDAYWRQPTALQDPPRFVLFVGGNAQKYEDWLWYFHLFSDDSGLGFLCFNFRGVARSEGTVTRPEDLINDVRAAFDFLVEEGGVRPEHILLHGFSLGGAVAALFLAQPGAPRAAITSDRSFRSYAHAGFAMLRGHSAAMGEPPPLRARVGTLSELGAANWLRAQGRALTAWLLLLARALAGYIAYEALRAVGWELDAHEAWKRIEGKKVLVYNTADNIIAYGGASLHHALACEAGSDQLPGVSLVEITIRKAPNWQLHDFPLSLDLDAWYAMLAAEKAALGVGGHDDGAGGLDAGAGERGGSQSDMAEAQQSSTAGAAVGSFFGAR